MVNLKQMCCLKESSLPEATWTLHVQADVWSHKGSIGFFQPCRLSFPLFPLIRRFSYLFKQHLQSLRERVLNLPAGLFWPLSFSSLWPAFVSLQGIPLTKKTAMLEQLGKCYIYLIGLYMAIGEISLHKIEFPILMREFRAAENISALSKESNFVITEYLRG